MASLSSTVEIGAATNLLNGTNQRSLSESAGLDLHFPHTLVDVGVFWELTDLIRRQFGQSDIPLLG